MEHIKHTPILHSSMQNPVADYKLLYPIGVRPPLGYVPPKMHAWVIRPHRYGEPRGAFQIEVLDVPEPEDDEVLVYVMAAGVNYNGVRAATGKPVDLIRMRQKTHPKEDFHVAGSDASGIVYKVGKSVTRAKVGDEVVVYSGWWDPQCPQVQAGLDPTFSPTFRAWGYETNWGSFAQFALIKEHQYLPKPKRLSWQEAACYLVSGATAYRMLHHWSGNTVQADDVVLIWGAAGGLGSQAIQIARAAGAIPVAVISDDSKRDFCISLGAKGCINRSHFTHWGMLPHWSDTVAYSAWLKEARAFGSAIWNIVERPRNPKIVFEHPGESSIPTSTFVCDAGGMVVICGGTSGYNATLDLRYHWMRQKRFQGSHFANYEEAQKLNQMIAENIIDPCLAKVFVWEDLPLAHQLMYENNHPHGNMVVRVGDSQPEQL